MRAMIVTCSPEECAMILNGDESLLVRKLKPNCKLPIEVYIYCTKDEVYDLFWEIEFGEYATYLRFNQKFHRNRLRQEPLNGKVVAKFTLNKVEEIAYDFGDGYEMFQTSDLECDMLNARSCLKDHELKKYLKPKREHGITCGYAWHIEPNSLKIFDKPKEISEFEKRVGTTYYRDVFGKEDCAAPHYESLEYAPTNYCYVEV